MVQIRSSFWYYVFLVFLTLATFKYLGPYRNYYASTFKKTKHLNDDERLADFYETWCGIRKHQTDWKKIQQPCDGLMQWGSTKKGDWNEQTDASESRIISKDIRPTCKQQPRTQDYVASYRLKVHLRPKTFITKL